MSSKKKRDAAKDIATALAYGCIDNEEGALFADMAGHWIARAEAAEARVGELEKEKEMARRQAHKSYGTPLSPEDLMNLEPKAFQINHADKWVDSGCQCDLCETKRNKGGEYE